MTREAPGLVIGVLAGYFGGTLDEILMRLSDVFLAFPKLILAIAFAAALGPGVENAIVAISVANWGEVAKTMKLSLWATNSCGA